VAQSGYRAFTANCNTLTVEGDGQIEEGSVFGCRKREHQTGRIIGFHAGKTLAYAAGAAAQCYLPEVGLTRFDRHVLFFKPDIVIVFDEVETSRARRAEMHFVCPIIESSGVDRAPKPNVLRILDGTRAHLTAQRAGLLIVTPSALNVKMEQTPCPMARNYCDRDSRSERITLVSAAARRHRFLTVLLPLAPNRPLRAARIEEWSNAGRIGLTVKWLGRELQVAIPRNGRGFRDGETAFRGRLIACDRVGERIARVAGLGVTRMEATGLETIRRDGPENVFVEMS
jgi:hypothetical protein